LLKYFCRPWSLEVSDAWIFVLPTTLSTAFLPKGFADPVEEEVLRSEGAMVPDIGLMMVRVLKDFIGVFLKF